MPESSTASGHETVTVTADFMTGPGAIVTVGASTVGGVVSVEGTCGTTALDGEDAGPGPTELVATTLNVYESPLVRPLTVHAVLAVEQVRPSGADVTV